MEHIRFLSSRQRPQRTLLEYSFRCFLTSQFLKSTGDRIMETRLQEAQLYKEKGNQRYREGKYRDAVSGYHRALLQLRGLDPSLPSPIPNLGPQGPALTPEQENILHTTQTDCYNNLAACLLQMEPVNYERVKEYSQKVLERQPDNAKALYRAGVAFFHLQDYDQARHYLLAAVNRQPKGGGAVDRASDWDAEGPRFETPRSPA
ncbi:tetratricopeptide repeat protein 9C isoform X2 [Saccopteryx bilineata]|uniref:tetratricopeptide repeat protein 9C isoform X2 n=1 Tax=Saccopteryx bilineata TaxID=59482 RepID=UPI00338F5990